MCAGLPACLPTGCVCVCLSPRVCGCVCVFVHKKQTNKNVISLTNKIDFYCIPLATRLPPSPPPQPVSFCFLLACFRFICRTRFAFPFASFFLLAQYPEIVLHICPCLCNAPFVNRSSERVESRFRFHMS